MITYSIGRYICSIFEASPEVNNVLVSNTVNWHLMTLQFVNCDVYVLVSCVYLIIIIIHCLKYYIDELS